MILVATLLICEGFSTQFDPHWPYYVLCTLGDLCALGILAGGKPSTAIHNNHRHQHYTKE